MKMQLFPITGEDLVSPDIFDTQATFAAFGIETELVPVNSWLPRNEGHAVVLTWADSVNPASRMAIARGYNNFMA